MMHERVPLVALVGRPNVGKSSIFNRLVGRRTALVDDSPGVTRDRIFARTSLDDRVVSLVDTGGIDIAPGEPLLCGMRRQTQLALDEADLVALVVDTTTGVTPADLEIARMLRRGGTPTVVLANKVDLPQHDVRAADAYSLGLTPVFAVSAEHGRGFGPLIEDLIERLRPPLEEALAASSSPIPVAASEVAVGESVVEWQEGTPIRVAVVGRPNVGKSSLVNRLLGEERLLATPVAGTTRDPIDTQLVHEEQPFVLIDTAGVRRKRSIGSRLERFAVVKAFQSIDRADVVAVVLDASERPTEQDARIAGLAHDKGKAVVLVVNKWDLPENPDWRTAFADAVRQRMPFLEYAPLLRLSAKTGRGLRRLLPTLHLAQMERHRRVGTSALNRFFRDVVATHPPPVRRSKRSRLYFVSQPLVCPPTFVFSVNNPEIIHFSYRRYLENALRHRFGFGGTPIWLKFRPRGA